MPEQSIGVPANLSIEKSHWHGTSFCLIAMIKNALLTTLLLTAAVSLHATEFYVAPSLVPTGNGTMSNPWDLQTALHSTAVKPGDTIWVRGGTHRFGYTNANGVYGPMPTKFDSTLLGSSAANITVRAYPGERVIIDGNLQQKINGYVTFWGLEIMDSLPGRYTDQAGPFPTTWYISKNGKLDDMCVSGVDISGNPDSGSPYCPGMKFINCIVHDNIGGGFGLSRGSAGVEVYGCLVYYNGWKGYNTATYQPQDHGHGFYIQHAGTVQTVIKDSFSFQNYAQGAQYYGTKVGYADYGTYDGLVMWHNSHFQPVQQRNMEYGNPAPGYPMINPQIMNCMVYDNRGSGSDSEFGDGGGMTGYTFTNNYFGSPVNFMGPLVNPVAFSGNTFAQGVSGTVNSGNTGSYPGNTFLWAQPSTGLKINVYPNKYEQGRGNIAIINWGKLSTVTVDISNVGLNVGDVYELHQAEDYFNDVTVGTYTGAPITINMTGHTVARPVGYSDTGVADTSVLTQPSSFPTFGAFVIMKKSGSTPTPVNTAPTITSIASQTLANGTSSSALAFTIGDAQTAATSLTVAASSSNTALIPNANIVLGGSGANRTVTVTPVAGQSGTAAVTLTVSDGTASTSSSFSVTVQAPVNTPPTITSIGSQTLANGTSSSALAFTIGDAQTAATSLTVAASSSNTALIPNANIVLGGSGANRTVTVTPVAGQSGTAVVTLTVSDGTASTSTSFSVTVQAPVVVNTAPVISSVAAQTIPANTSSTIPFTVSDAQTAAGSLTVTATSSDTTLVPATGLVLGGSGSSRTLTITPATGKSGTAMITLRVSDGSLTANSSFQLTVSAAPVAPTISAIANQSTAQNTATAPIAFTVADADTSVYSLTVTASSANTALVPNANIALGGSGSSRTITLVPATGQSGQATITVRVSDGSLSSSTSFVLTVNPATSTNTPSTSLVALGFEASSAQIVAPMQLVTDPTMTARKYFQSTAANSGTATFTVNIPKTDTYVIWSKVLAPSYTNDSFFVSVDGAEDIYDEAEGRQSPNWQWTQVNGRAGTGVPGAVSPRTFNLSQGQHTIVFRGREAYSSINRIIVVNDRNYVPVEMTAANDTLAALPNTGTQIGTDELVANDTSTFSDALTVSAVGAPTNGTAILGSGIVTYTPKAGFLGKDSFAYTVTDGMGGNASARVDVTVASSNNVRMGFEAESGTLVSPMVAVTDSTLSTRKYIWSTAANQGSATFNVNIPKTGEYVLWCKVLCPDYTKDSFFVTVNGVQDIYDAAEGTQSPNWQWTCLNGRNGTSIPRTLNPRVLALTQGVQKIVIQGREAYTALDRMILTDDMTFVPKDVVAVDDAISALANTAKVIATTDLLRNDYSLFGDSFQMTSVSAPKNGTATLAGTSITYMPKSGFTGLDSFTYTIKDAQGNTATATVNVTVQ